MEKWKLLATAASASIVVIGGMAASSALAVTDVASSVAVSSGSLYTTTKTAYCSNIAAGGAVGANGSPANMGGYINTVHGGVCP